MRKFPVGALEGDWGPSPISHFLRGSVILIGVIVGIIGFITLTIYLIVEIDILAVASIYIIGTVILAICRIVLYLYDTHWNIRCWVYYDPDTADRAGSTARYGIPHDYGVIVPPGRLPYDPDIHDK